jgi:hypothetical protein
MQISVWCCEERLRICRPRRPRPAPTSLQALHSTGSAARRFCRGGEIRRRRTLLRSAGRARGQRARGLGVATDFSVARDGKGVPAAWVIESGQSYPHRALVHPLTYTCSRRIHIPRGPSPACRPLTGCTSKVAGQKSARHL